MLGDLVLESLTPKFECTFKIYQNLSVSKGKTLKTISLKWSPMIPSLRYVKEFIASYYCDGLMSYKTQALTHVFWHTYWDDKILPDLKEWVEETMITYKNFLDQNE